jgi:hypothetical protein
MQKEKATHKYAIPAQMTTMSWNVEVPKRHLSIFTTVFGSIKYYASSWEQAGPIGEGCYQNKLVSFVVAGGLP